MILPDAAGGGGLVLSLADMPSDATALTMTTASRPEFALDVPGSKSITNRALVVAALARGESRLRGALVAEDTEVMLRALERLGFEVHASGTTFTVRGRGGEVPSAAAELDLILSGTSIRFLTALAALGHGRYRLTGNARMQERPILELLTALRQLGVNAASERGNGCPPVVVDAEGLPGGRAEVPGDRSSQFLSALLLAAPCAAGPVTLESTGDLQSKPFVDVTVSLMEAFGARVERDGYERFTVAPTGYDAREYAVEGDATAAGYFWAAAAVTGGSVRVGNVGSAALQGDKRFAEVLGRMGCEVEWEARSCRVTGPAGPLRGGTFDFNDIPDQALTLAVVALFARDPVRIENIPNLRLKETDRLAALATELRKLGAAVEEGPDFLVVAGGPRLRGAAIATYGDHRMAMAFAVAGLRIPGVVIEDPGCVAKTYPGFWRDWAELTRSAGGR